MPNFGLVPLSLAYGSGLRGPKNHNAEPLANRLIGLTTNSKKHVAVFNFPDYSINSNLTSVYHINKPTAMLPSETETKLLEMELLSTTSGGRSTGIH